MKRLMVFVLAISPAFGSYPYTRPITISHTLAGSSDLTDFPVLVSLNDPTFRFTGSGGHVQNANGYDINFYSDPGLTTPLSWEVESYSGADGAATVWVRIPTLSHTSDTVIYVGYGDATKTTFQSTATSVWDSNFKAVYHLAETSVGKGATLADSTSHGVALTVSGSSQSAVAGQSGGAVSFSNGGNQYAANGAFSTANPGVSSGNTTVEGWVKLNRTFSADGLIMLFGGVRGTYPYGYDSLLVRPSDGTVFGVEGQDAYATPGSTTKLNTSKFRYLTLTYDHSTVTLYIDGAVAASGSSSYALVDKPFGINGEGTLYANDAQYDELRVSATVRSADWITATYNNQSSPGTFISIGSETSMTTGSGTSSGASGGIVIRASGSPQGTATTLDVLAGTGVVCVPNVSGSTATLQCDADTAYLETVAAAQRRTELNFVPTSASGTTYTGGMSPTLTSYGTGRLVLHFFPDVNGAGGATYLNIDGLGKIALKQADGTTDPTSSDIVASNLYLVWFDGSVARLFSSPLFGHTGTTCSAWKRGLCTAP